MSYFKLSELKDFNLDLKTNLIAVLSSSEEP